MRFDGLRAKGIGPFREEIEIDFTKVPGPLVAITGSNGEGKTTLLELLGAGCYRTCPTRGSLADLATSRDSFLEVRAVNGAPHRFRHIVDAVSGKTESVVCDENGSPLTASAKVREFDAWAAKHLPPREVLYASTFAAQGSGGFISMKASERKAVLLRVLGIARYEALSEAAREHAKASRNDLSTLDARIADERARASNPTDVQAEIDALEARRIQQQKGLEDARAAADEALAKEQVAKLARQDVEAHVARRNELTVRLDKATRSKADVDTKLANNRSVLARAEEIRAAEERTKALDELVVLHGASLAKSKAERVAAENLLATAEQNLKSARARIEDAVARGDRARSRTADKAAVEKAAAELPVLRERLNDADVEVTSTEVKIEEAQALSLNSATQRIEQLRSGLEKIATDGDVDRIWWARHTLCEDDELAAKAEEAPAVAESERARLREFKSAREAARSAVTAAERLAARAAEIAAAEAEAEEAAREVAKLQTELDGMPTTDALVAEVARLSAEIATHERTIAAAVSERETLAPVVKLADPLTRAEGRVAELEPQAAALAEEIAAIGRDLDALGDLPEDVKLPDVAAARAAVDAASAGVNSTEAAIAVKKAQFADANAAAERIAVLDTERRRIEGEIADWVRLSDDLGRDGLQALEIDAAGPELTELVNDLLRTCGVTRWTVSIEASRLSADGKKTLEGCEVRVVDNEKAREGSAESLSGGEGVIVGEAIALSLSMLACRRGGVQGPTIVRDESGAALDPKNARAYVAMLRRAAEIVGASRVLFVTHNPEVQELADARIEISNGKVRAA